VISLAVINLKGGTGKTTSTAFFGHAFHEAGLRTLGVDADGENESLAEWQSLADWPFPVVGMAINNLHKQLPGVTGDRYDAVVIDTPPMKEQRGIVLSALRYATHAVIPVAPTPMEYARLPAVRQILEDAAELRPDGKPPVCAVLLTRCVAGAASTEVFRKQIEEFGMTVLRPQVNRLEKFSQAYGDPVNGASNTAYGDAVNELLDMEVPE
jgi:chromosome partitioning protein